MKFQFDSFQDFLAMGGHGMYVWIAYGVVAAVVVALIINVSSREKIFLKQQRKIAQRLQQHQNNLDS